MNRVLLVLLVALTCQQVLGIIFKKHDESLVEKSKKKDDETEYTKSEDTADKKQDESKPEKDNDEGCKEPPKGEGKKSKDNGAYKDHPKEEGMKHY